MKKLVCFGLLSVFCLLISACLWRETSDVSPSSHHVAHLKEAESTEQIIFVGVTNGSRATLSLYENGLNGWEEILTSPAYIGKNGLGKQREGDGKTPIGVYRFTMAFGIAEDPGTNLPYTQVDADDYWNGDSSSPTYNQFVSTTKTQNFDRTKSEHLIDYQDAYQYVLALNYNEQGIPMKGSAIFLHANGKKPYTAGCVAIPLDKMREIIRRVRPCTRIIIDGMANLKKVLSSKQLCLGSI